MNLTPLYDWYEREKRELPWRETTDPYRIWLSEVILQQTRVQQGMDYWWRFVQRWPEVHNLATATEDEVLLMWQGLGYYSRARNLHKAAQLLDQGLRQAEEAGDQEQLFRFWHSLPGIGEYTAGAILSFAYNAPYPAADGNVYRVLSRLFDCDEPFDTTTGKKHFRQLAWDILDHEQPRLHNSAIMEFGALYCTPGQPDCHHCPIRESCRAYATGTAALLPVRKARPQLRDRYLRYTFYLTPDGMTLIHQRTDKDIWQHLYEFPLEELPSAEQLGANGRAYKHVLSHQRLHALFVEKRVSELPQLPGCIAIKKEALQDYALSRLTLRFLEDIR